MDVSAWVVWVAACLFWVAAMEWSSAQLVGVVGDFSASHSRIIDKTCFTGGVKEVCSVSLRPQQKLGDKKTGPVENWNRNRKKKTKTKGGPKNLFSAACTLLIRQALRFTIYLRAKSNYCMCHNFHSTLGVTKKPKITKNIHIRSFITSLWATQPPKSYHNI